MLLSFNNYNSLKLEFSMHLRRIKSLLFFSNKFNQLFAASQDCKTNSFIFQPTPYETWLRGFTAGNRIRVVGISGPEARRFAVTFFSCGNTGKIIVFCPFFFGASCFIHSSSFFTLSLQINLLAGQEYVFHYNARFDVIHLCVFQFFLNLIWYHN